MHSNLLISIIIPCYNDAQYIEQAVQSALDQTYPYKEIIVVDDGSNAETKAVLKKLESKITLLITQENQGQSTARNVGINAAKGDFILVLDSDDYFEPSFCEEAVAIFSTDASIKIVTCQAALLFSDNKKKLYIPNGGDINNFMYGNCALGTSMFKKEDWLKCGGYDESMRSGFEDWDFWLSMLELGGKVYRIPEKLFYYRLRDISRNSSIDPVKLNILRLNFY